MGRTSKSIKNIALGIMFQLINLSVSFVTRTYMIRFLGWECISLNGLFNEVIAMISMAELGVGNAIIYNLYLPLAMRDEKKITQLMNLYKKAYLIIASVTLLIGGGLTFFIQHIVSDIDFPTRYIQLIFFLFVIQTASSYLFSYKTSLLNADQKKYMLHYANIASKLAGAVLLIVIMRVTQNYVIYLTASIAITLATNIISSCIADHMYPFIHKKTESLSKRERKKIFANVRDLFIKKLSGQITNSTDNILISVLISTLQVGFYSNYSLIFSAIKQLESQICGGIAASIGNLFATEKSAHIRKTLNNLTFLFYVFAIWVSTCLFMCASTFVKMWIGERYTMPVGVIAICSFNIFLYIAKDPLWQSLEASGLFSKDKNISIIGSGVNLVISLAAGYALGSHDLGMYGIFGGTAISQLVQVFLKIRLLHRDRLSTSARRYYFTWVKMLLSAVVSMTVSYIICNNITPNGDIVRFIANGLISSVISIAAALIFFFRSDEMNGAVGFVKGIISSRLRKES